MAEIQVTINDQEERIYKIFQVESLFSEIDKLTIALHDKQKELDNMKTERRIIYQDVKKIHEIIPMENGNVNLMQLPRIIQKLTSNPNAIEAFNGIAKFVQSYEQNNLIPIEK
jgi:hypothetical protein